MTRQLPSHGAGAERDRDRETENPGRSQAFRSYRSAIFRSFRVSRQVRPALRARGQVGTSDRGVTEAIAEASCNGIGALCFWNDFLADGLEC